MDPLLTLSWPGKEVSAILGIGLLLRTLPLSCFASNKWWWVPIVAPLLGAYLGGVIYVVFISTPRKRQRLENSEDHRITVLPKANLGTSSSLAPPSATPTPPLGGSMPLEHF